MKIRLSYFAFLFIVLVSCSKKDEKVVTPAEIVEQELQPEPEILKTTFILSRHAEVLSGSNPNLSVAGLARADSLVKELNSYNLDAVYSSDYNRTKQTATPTATDKSLTVDIYNAFALDNFVDSVLSKHLHKTILVVGHSNTTPDIINILLDSIQYSNIPESEYDNLYFVEVIQKGDATVTHIKYGN